MIFCAGPPVDCHWLPGVFIVGESDLLKEGVDDPPQETGIANTR
jgi:hypothetical protein